MNVAFADVSLGVGRRHPFADPLGIFIVHHYTLQFAWVQGSLTGFGKIRISSKRLECGYGLFQFSFKVLLLGGVLGAGSRMLIP